MNEMMENGEMMADMDGSSGSAKSYARKGTKTRDRNSLRASEVGHPAPAGHLFVNLEVLQEIKFRYHTNKHRWIKYLQ